MKDLSTSQKIIYWLVWTVSILGLVRLGQLLVLNILK